MLKEVVWRRVFKRLYIPSDIKLRLKVKVVFKSWEESDKQQRMHPLPHLNNVTQTSDLGRNPESVTCCVTSDTLSKFSCPQILLCDLGEDSNFCRRQHCKARHIMWVSLNIHYHLLPLYNAMFPGMCTFELWKRPPLLCQSQPIESEVISWECLGALMLMMDLPHNRFS